MNFDIIRPIFGGKLSQDQVDGINAIEKAFAAHGNGSPMSLAYLLATAKHETADTMQPIYERGAKAYFNKYEPGTAIGKRLGNTLKGDGYKYRGRGYVQLTGRANYAKAGQKLALGDDQYLVKDPDQALGPTLAARILVRGCIEGWFTGKKLGDYTTFTGMRRVVNGTDKATLIAGYAEVFQKALAAKAPKAAKPKPETTITVKTDGEKSVTTTIPADTLPPAPPRPNLNRLWLVLLSIATAIASGIGAIFTNGGPNG